MLATREKMIKLTRNKVEYFYKRTFQYFTEREVMEVRYIVKQTTDGRLHHEKRKVIKSEINYVPRSKFSEKDFKSLEVEPLTTQFPLSLEQLERVIEKGSLFDERIISIFK
ncbi:hypothetical protein LCY76_23610 [Fictibacillus sp. KIGAM418]|uniref:Uncharacterized protein n=1 Tax=Fictibacillus marinisediminis TaxID=2878389 RepID=A0A9X1XIH8_9BACL|nr:hypothetical protein [Fictibacillus marinisediminis]MCK6259560.1 hypothetical protein [Fictibacillus marinisediminis]